MSLSYKSTTNITFISTTKQKKSYIDNKKSYHKKKERMKERNGSLMT